MVEVSEKPISKEKYGMIRLQSSSKLKDHMPNPTET